MDNQYPYTTSPEERAARRAERIAARKARERARRKRIFLRCIPLAVLAAVVIGLLLWAFGSAEQDDPPISDTADSIETMAPVTPPEEPESEPEPEFPYSAKSTSSTSRIGAELSSQHAIVIDLDSDTIIAQKGARTVISPASMTKIMTVLVAAEFITDESQLDDTVTIDLEITDYCYINDCSPAGFLLDEAVPVRDLFYGTILPSGGDAALALARYVGGSHEGFVELMNKKAEELGLSDTARFANCVGIYDENNVCTVYDMAMILQAALDNDLAREVLTTKVYEIPANELHPEGMILSNWFLRRIEDHVSDGMQVLGAKTGYVNESGNCAASYCETDDGGHYICVTANTTSAWQCIRDHIQLYDAYAK